MSPPTHDAGNYKGFRGSVPRTMVKVQILEQKMPLASLSLRLQSLGALRQELGAERLRRKEHREGNTLTLSPITHIFVVKIKKAEAIIFREAK